MTTDAKSGDRRSVMLQREYYDADILPYVIWTGVMGDGDRQVFEITADRPFPTSDMVVRAVEAGCEIVIRVENDSGKTFDLGSIAEAIPRIVTMQASVASTITGWEALRTATALESFVIFDGKPREMVDFSELPSLRNAGVVGTTCLSVCDNPNLRSLALRMEASRAVPVISGPVSVLSLTSKVASAILEQMAQPEELRSLLVLNVRDFDCGVLARFPNLDDVSLYACTGVRNAAAFGRLPALRTLELERCRDIDDPDAVAAVERRLQQGAAARRSQ